MRAKEFLLVETNLFEVNMSPGNLAKLADDVPGAKIGIEFEMYVPGVNVGDDNDDDFETEMELDFDADERADDIDDIIKFFGEDDRNTGYDRNNFSSLQLLRRRLTNRYQVWLKDELDSVFDKRKKEVVYDYVKENIPESTIVLALDIDDDLFGNKQVTSSDISDYVDLALENPDSDIVKSAFDHLVTRVMKQEEIEEIEDFDVTLYSEGAWLDEENLDSMKAVYEEFSNNIEWPHQTYIDNNSWDNIGSNSGDSFADEFSDVMERPVRFSSDVSAQPPSDGYIVVPDGSLTSSDGGLEIKSAPFPIDVMRQEIEKIHAWAKDNNVRTNDKTGMHINVSVPSYSLGKLDYVKLVLLLGDEHVSKQFDRYNVTYAKSSFDVIKQKASTKNIEQLFSKLKSNMEEIASKVIHGINTNKYVSVGIKDNRIEFRAPGNDYLGKYYDKVIDTVNRTVVALDAACDPTKYRKEYLKKLTKMFAPTKGSIEDVFVQYQAGTITRAELKEKLKTTQAIRIREKLTKEGVIELYAPSELSIGDFVIEYDNPTGASHRMFLMRTEQVSDVNKAAAAAMKLDPRRFNPNDIENIIVTEYNNDNKYVVLDRQDNIIGEYYAVTPLMAINLAISFYSDLAKQDLTAISATKYRDLERMARAAVTMPTTSAPEATPQDQDMLYLVSRGIYRAPIAARSPEEAARIATTLYSSRLGTSADQLEIVPDTSYSPEVITIYRRNQESELNQLNSN